MTQSKYDHHRHAATVIPSTATCRTRKDLRSRRSGFGRRSHGREDQDREPKANFVDGPVHLSVTVPLFMTGQVVVSSR